MRAILPLLAALAFAACTPPTAPSDDAESPRRTCFPCRPYTRIQACSIHPDGSPIACNDLIPAHKADLQVALLLNPSPAPIDTLNCHIPSHGFRYLQGDSLVATLTLSRECRSIRYQPNTGWRTGPAGFDRMQTVMEEIGYWK